MAADYDAPRLTDDDGALDTIVIPRKSSDELIDVDDLEQADGGGGWGDIESDVVVIPLQATEFVCSGCFLMVDRLQLVTDKNGAALCRDCAA
jgi:hypothetical protein